MPVLRRHWFLVGYLLVLATAAAWPGPGSAGGVLRLDALKPWCIAGIFLCAGLVLPSHQLLHAAQAWRTHALVQGLSFILAPLLGLAIAWLAGLAGAPVAVQTGLLILACLPTTIGSCVALTGLAGGNQGLALVNSVLGNLLGLAATPLLVSLLVGHEGSLPLGTVIGHLALLAALPVALGQLARVPAAAWLERQRTCIGSASSLLLLLVLLGIFSDLAGSGLGRGSGLAGQAALACLVLHLALVAAAWLITSGRCRGDRIAITLTASQKTAALGIPLISLLYAADPDLPLLLLPVVAYHLVQTVAGSLAASIWPSR